MGFGSYTFNTAQGGGVSVSLARHTGTAGIVYLKPFEAPGEISLGLMIMSPNQEIFDGDARTQYGVETYWKILLTPHVWVTPGIQLVFHPARTQELDFSAIPHVKFRMAF